MSEKTSSFAERYKNLNTEQRHAVDTLDGPVMVIAGPGTGKTTVLTMRIANILGAGEAGKTKADSKTSPEKVLALTFTESGAIAIRRNLVDLIGQSAYRVEISTFHGFANRIIRDYPDYFPHIISATSITEIDQVKNLRKIIDTLPLKDLRPFGERYHYLKNILSAINELKRQGVPPEQFAKIAAQAKEAFYANPDLINTSGKYEGKMKGKYATAAKQCERNVELAQVYEAYQKALKNPLAKELLQNLVNRKIPITDEFLRQAFELDAARGHHYRLLLRQRCLQTGRLRLVREEQHQQISEDQIEETQSLGPIRHARQRRRMVPGSIRTFVREVRRRDPGRPLDPIHAALSALRARRFMG